MLLLCVWLDIIKKINFFAIVSFIKAEYYLFHLFFIWAFDFVLKIYNKWFFAVSIIYDTIKYFINVNILTFFYIYLQLLIIYYLISLIYLHINALLQNSEQIIDNLNILHNNKLCIKK